MFDTTTYFVIQIETRFFKGGDGIAHEIVNGLLCKTQKISDKSIDVSADKLVSGFNYVKPDFRLGIIPAGSTNALVYSMQGICLIVYLVLGKR